MGEILLDILSFFFDISYLRKKQKECKTIGWFDIIISPTVRFTILFGLFLGTSIGLFRMIFNDSIKTSQTEKKMEMIVESIESYYSDLGVLPESIHEIIGMRPLRKNWETDSWGSNIIISKDQNDHLFKVISIGPDRLLGTEDDIIFWSKTAHNNI